ncbi:putative T7SS-secreted protein [Streptomyces sp. NPDC102278]|uniref:putative T7SS-secreted protein n=1 Tax=Streptomyces sp. NPDC102278 TaxID=3366152 RepID=UPI0037FEC312
MARDLNDWLEAGGKAIGEGLEWAGDKTADGLEKVGWQDGANAVRSGANAVANRLGADVGEVALGQTDDPKKLIHGSASKLRATASHLSDFQTAFDLTGEGLKGLDHDGIQGASAEGFRTKAQKQPPLWFAAADAFETAAGALNRFADTVEWAQGRAQEALDEYKTAVEMSVAAHDAYNKWVDSYNVAVRAKQDPLPARPMGFTDPGTDGIKAAREKLAEARRQRDEAARAVVQSLRTARDAAPPLPSAAMQLASQIFQIGVETEHLGGGVVKGAAGAISFFRAVDPTDPYNRMHPAEYKMQLSGMGVGLMSMVNDPNTAASRMYDGFMKDPGEGVGKFIFEAATTKGVGAGASAIRRGATLGRLANGELPKPHLPDAPDHKPSARDNLNENKPDKSREQDCKTCVDDPVDVATGRMVLPQTDLVLPGSLPLVFGRTFESSYRSGRWFGPTWASTVDQRLEIDAEGVILVQPDGSLLEYPHPEPAGAPVLPTLGRRLPMTRDADGWYTVTDPETGQVRHFSEDGLLSQIDDRNGAWIAFTYEEETGAPLALSHSGGYEVHMTSAEGRITGLALADGTEILRYGYSDGHLTEVTNSSGRPLRFGYDALGRITSWTDTNDRHFNYVYDARHRCIAQSSTNGHLNVRFAYEDGITTRTDSLGHATRYVVNDHAQVVAETDVTGATTYFTYDRYNRLLTRIDPLGRSIRLSYDDSGHLTSIIRPDERVSRAEYNALGLPTLVVNPDGTTIRQTYDTQGNRTSLTDPSGATTVFRHDERGHLAAATDAHGHTTTTRFNPAGLLMSTTDPLGATTTYGRDSFGRIATITDALDRTTRLTWSVEGRLLRRVNPAGDSESWTYDGEGNLLTQTDAAGGVTTSEYGDFDLLTARTGPDGARYSFAHDTELRLTTVTSPQGLEWGYTYDAAGRLSAETDFDSRTLTYGYDASGSLVSRTNALGQTTTYDRNALGQIVGKTTPAGTTTYTYDACDRPTSVSFQDSTITWQRDKAGTVISETVDGRTLAFSHDATGRRTTRVTPTGLTSSWTYDAAGNRTSLTTAGRTLTFERDAAGQELTRTVGAGLSLTQEYDAAGRLTTQTVMGPKGYPLQRRDYSYRADSYLTGIDDSQTGTRTFTLDSAARVTAVEAPRWSERYAYDEAGNQTRATWPNRHPGTEAQGGRSYTGTRINQAGAIRYEHDALGRVTLRQKTRLSRKPETWHYDWNAEDQLAAVVTPDGTRWRYAYDPLGRRKAKQRLSAEGSVVEETIFTWDGATLCEQTNGPVTLTWTHKGHHPLTQTERIDNESVDDRFFAIVTDLIGTPTQLLYEDGTTAWRTRSALWGTTTWNSDATAYTPMRFPGQYYDPESGLHHNLFRTYDPEAARYLTPDPLGLSPAPNPAAYVHNPLIGADPLGLAPEECPARGPYDFREPHPDHLPKPNLVDAMRAAPKGDYIDCTEISDYIMRQANGDGRIVHYITPSGNLRTPETGPDGIIVKDYVFHQVYTDGRYIYDPTLSPDPIPRGDYERALRSQNGERVIRLNGEADLNELAKLHRTTDWRR